MVSKNLGKEGRKVLHIVWEGWNSPQIIFELPGIIQFIDNSLVSISNIIEFILEIWGESYNNWSVFEGTFTHNMMSRY